MQRSLATVQAYEYPVRLIGYLPTRVQPRRALHQIYESNLRTAYGAQVFFRPVDRSAQHLPTNRPRWSDMGGDGLPRARRDQGDDMADARQSTVVGVFAERSDADQAYAALRSAGFADSQIGVAFRHGDGATAVAGTETGTRAEEGATAGTVAGLGLGALAGLGVLSGVIPVIGPAIAGGTLGVILSNAAAGAAVAGLTGALVGAGISEEDAGYYHGEFEAGRTIVTVQAAGRADEAASILRTHGAYDSSSRGSV